MMFDSTNLNPSSFHPLSFPFPSLPLLINTHQDLLLDHQYFPLSLPPNSPTIHETLVVGAMGAPGFCAPPPEPKAAAKKAATHSKIHTSQGLRDRRVRLSIGIAREFFDLQDMLGFEKASKTLDWLLSKSKNAIKELARAKHDESPPAASSTCHVATTTQMDSTGSNNHSGEVNHVKQITRARARSGRTRKKICCGNPTLTSQSALTRASTSSTSGQVNLPSQSSSGPSNKNKNQDNNYYFPRLALDWDDNVGYNLVLPPSSFAISNLNLTGIGLGAQREPTHADN